MNGHGGAAIFEPLGGAASAGTDLSIDDAAADEAERRVCAAVLGGPPFILDLAVLREATVGAVGGAQAFAVVSDATFLHGYGYTPALALLESRVLTSASRLGSAAHTAQLTVFAIDVSEQRATFIWRRDSLPHDCFSLVAVPAPVGELGICVGVS